MVDNTNVLDQNPVQPQQAPVQPVPSVGEGANKEVGRVVVPVSEFVTLSGAELVPNIPPEVSKHVEVKSDSPPLTEEHRQIGVLHAGPSVPPLTEPSGLVQSPLTPEEMASAAQTNPTNAIRWLREIINKTFNVIRLKNK